MGHPMKATEVEIREAMGRTTREYRGGFRQHVHIYLSKSCIVKGGLQYAIHLI